MLKARRSSPADVILPCAIHTGIAKETKLNFKVARQLILILFLVLPLIAPAQTFNKKYFNKTVWFADNKDSAFYKQDTIRLIKYSNRDLEAKSIEFKENPKAYLKHGEYITLAFRKKDNHLDFLERTEKGLSQSVTYQEGGNWKWNSNGQLLELYNRDSQISALKPLDERKVKIDERYYTQETLTTTEITFIRVK